LKLQALTARPVVENFEVKRTDETNVAQRDVALPQSTATGGSQSVMDSSMMAALMQQGQQPDPNRQAGKIDFLRSGGASLTPQGYSANLPVPQQFPYELKAGTIIPGIMLTGINSDLPGSVIAQVSENVWDTATGRFVLIPKGTRILGVYDSQVTFGQRRVLLVWNRLVFPNGTTLDIAGSPGVDQAGYSGLSGRVNEHWGAMLKAALLASVFVAGAEIVYDSDSQSAGNDNRSPRDVAAESAAGAILDMGARLVNRASDIQPTITIRPGRRMGIFVQRDVVFPYPYF
jgi:type IV secretion system protein VirB10